MMREALAWLIVTVVMIRMIVLLVAAYRHGQLGEGLPRGTARVAPLELSGSDGASAQIGWRSVK